MDVVPARHTASLGTMMSPSEGGLSLLMTMLVSRWFVMMRLPLDRDMGTDTPPSLATLSPQAPVALMRTLPLISLTWDVRRSRALTPTQRPFSWMTSTTSWCVRIPPPRWRDV
jgi:hypothetical protein